MIIQIELIIIFIVGLMFFIWAVWFRWTRRRLNKKYNPDNDKSRKGGKKRGSSEVGEPDSDTPKSSSSLPGPTESEGRGLLPSATDDVSGKNRPRLGNALRRIRRTAKTK